MSLSLPYLVHSPKDLIILHAGASTKAERLGISAHPAPPENILDTANPFVCQLLPLFRLGLIRYHSFFFFFLFERER